MAVLFPLLGALASTARCVRVFVVPPPPWARHMDSYYNDSYMRNPMTSGVSPLFHIYLRLTGG